MLRRSLGRHGRRHVTVKRMIVQNRAVAVALPQVLSPTAAEACLPRGWELDLDNDDDGG